jgi:MoaA/NifB/PqqE/SkfB family radical SAM enzyme
MPLAASILYRGPLSSCNYDCSYCPFAKHRETPQELAEDRASLARFCDWIESRPDDQLSLFFTPWGEALVRAWYREAVTTLSRISNIRKVAVQTNLSCKLDWLAETETEKIGLWCTYHPGETRLDNFLRQCNRLDDLHVRYSVGCVGLREHRDEIQRLRDRLPQSIYLWINAYKSEPNYYDDQLITWFERIDPHFPTNNRRHASLGRSCRCGSSVFTVDGAGDVRRCHFVDRVLGNIYEQDFEKVLQDRPCPNATCGCHIGYVHLDHLQLYSVYGDGILERTLEPLPEPLSASAQ